MTDERYRMVEAGSLYAGLWSIYDMRTRAVVTVRGRPLHHLDRETATKMLEVIRRGAKSKPDEPREHRG